MTDGIVIVGAGQAGAALAAKLRAEGHDGPVSLIGEEAAPPYQRPPLSKKYLLGEMARERLFLRPESWYREHEVTLLAARRVAAIEPAGRRIRLEDGETLTYARLALTTGARPRLLPAEAGGRLAGVHAVRTLADVDAMAADFEPGRRLLVIGGGYIGLEAAAVGIGRGLHVTLLEAAPRILGRVACAETAAWFADLHRSRGVDLREGAALARLEGKDGRLARAVLENGEVLEADFAVVGIGVQPADALAREAGLAVENGIAVDAACRTSDPRIFAAGDCASFPWRRGRIRLESVQNAIDQAETAALAMLGADVAYDPVPWFWSDQYEVKLQIAGLAAGWDRIVPRDGPREGSRSHWYFREGELIAVDAISDPRAYMTGKRWLEAGRSPDAAALADPATDLRAL